MVLSLQQKIIYFVVVFVGLFFSVPANATDFDRTKSKKIVSFGALLRLLVLGIEYDMATGG